MASPTPSYADALARLSLLQSNRAVTSLFASPPAASSPKGGDLNALAIPEMLAWLNRAGYTPASLAATSLRVIHIAGTKGKGSVSALASSILGQYPDACSGGGVGLYTSPHVVSVRERIAINGVPISREKFAKYFFEVWDRLSDAARQAGDADPDGPDTKPFYFRFLTILAMHVFVREGLKDAVVECGIGGEYDSTNFLGPEMVSAAVVTQLGVDHVGMLGRREDEIAWHKAGIWKTGVKGFTRRLDEGRDEVMRVLRERAKERGADLVEVGDEVVEGWEGVDGAKLQGPFQRYNMALAVAAAREHLIKRGVRFAGEFGRDGYSLESMPEEFRRGLKEAMLRGRCEVIEDAEGIKWFIDGAHTDDSLAGVGVWFAGQTKDQAKDMVRVLLFNQQDRDVSALMDALLKAAKKEGGDETAVFDHAIFTRNEERPPTADEPSRDLTVQTKASEALLAIDASTEVSIQDSVGNAVTRVRDIAAQARREGKVCRVLATGSFHLIGAVIKMIDSEAEE